MKIEMNSFRFNLCGFSFLIFKIPVSRTIYNGVNGTLMAFISFIPKDNMLGVKQLKRSINEGIIASSDIP